MDRRHPRSIAVGPVRTQHRDYGNGLRNFHQKPCWTGPSALLSRIRTFAGAVFLRQACGVPAQMIFPEGGDEIIAVVVAALHSQRQENARFLRSEGRRVGKECVSWCRSRWSAFHLKKKTLT